MLAMLSGANGFEDMSNWMEVKKSTIRKFLNKPFKVPAYTTIRNVFLNIDVEEINKMFNNWSSSCIDSSKQLNIVAADGKVMRGSMDRIKNTNAKQILSLFATTSKITLAQQDIDTKSNEIPAPLELLETLELKDAMHNQKKLYKL
jgi:hypothetical protein